MSSERPHRFGIVGILGRPNVGKSTLLNRVLGQKLAIATPKPQTTRNRIKGIRTFEDWQVVWVDTPGIHEAQTKLNRYMVELAVATVSDVDLCYLLVDAEKAIESAAKAARVEAYRAEHGGAHGNGAPAGDEGAQGAPEAGADAAQDPNAPNDPNAHDKVLAETKAIVEIIKAANKKCFLVLNKVDRVPEKAELFAVIERYAPLYPFAEVVPVSAKTSSNIERLLEVTRSHLSEGEPLFSADELTDRPMRFIATEIIREQLFLQLGQELPYNAAADVLSWEEKGDGLVVIHANIHVARKSHKPIVVGKGGAQIKAIGEKARGAIERLLERKVYLDLRVKVDEGWTDRDDKLKALGYNEME